MRYVKRVESNVKGGVAVDLGPRTLIVGPNASNKSAVVNSVEFALTGAVSDVVGRALVKEANALLALGDGEGLWATAVLDEDRSM